MKIRIDTNLIGNPAGFEYATEDKNAPYIDHLPNYYRTYKPGKQLSIQKHYSGYTLYTFIIGQTQETGKFGRLGGMFGLMLAVRGNEITDINSVYKLLNHIYETKIRGKILSDKDIPQWQITHNEFESVRRALQSAAESELPKYLTAESFKPFKFNPNGKNVQIFYPQASNPTKKFNNAKSAIQQKTRTPPTIAPQISNNEQTR